MSRPLKKQFGLIVCPDCGQFAFVKRFRIDKRGIFRRLRMCPNGHLFGTYQILYLERMQGDVIPFRDLIKQSHNFPGR